MTLILAVRWYCKYGISYRDLEEMLTERGVVVKIILQFIDGFNIMLQRFWISSNGIRNTNFIIAGE